MVPGPGAFRWRRDAERLKGNRKDNAAAIAQAEPLSTADTAISSVTSFLAYPRLCSEAA
jgi:hypothetical protein